MSSIHKEFTFDPAYLNASLQSLGKYSRTGCFWFKSFLACDKDGGCKILQLNLIQILARKLFGFYQETHLKKVILAWNDYQTVQGNTCPELSEKLSSLWSKNHPTQILLPVPEVFLFGNSKLKDAEVIGVCQLFSDPNNSKFCGKVLSENYQEGDVILVEGVDASIKIAAKDDPQTVFLSKSADIYGWEPVGYSELNHRVFETTISIQNEFQNNFAIAVKLLCNINFLEKPQEFKFNHSTIDELGLGVGEREKLWGKLLDASVKKFLNASDKIESRFSDKEPLMGKDIELSTSSLSLLIELRRKYQRFLQTSQSKQDCALLTLALKGVYAQCNQFLQKKKYSSGWTVDQDNFFKNTWKIRQESLSNEINQYRELSKRVFVCAGAAHFFPNKGKNLSEVMATLSQYKFTLVISNIKQNAAYYSFQDLAKKYKLRATD